MAIAHDAQTRFPATDITGTDTTTGDRTFTHTPVGNPAGVIVVVNCVGTTVPCSGVLYGGVPMTPESAASDTSEAGSVWIWRLTDVPIASGPQTVTLQGCIAAAKFATCSTVTSATDLSEIVGAQGKSTTTGTNPTVSVVTSKESLLYGGLHGGATDPTVYTPGTGYTTQFSVDYGSLSARTQRRTSPVASGTIAYNFPYGTSDDYCLAAVAIAEKTGTSFGAISSPLTFNKNVVGQRKTFSGILSPFTFSKEIIGRRETFSGISLPIILNTEVLGRLNVFGEILLPIIFDKEIVGQRITFSEISLPIIFTKDLSGFRRVFSEISFPIIFDKEIVGQRETFGQSISEFINDISIQGLRETFGSIDFPIEVFIDTDGHLQLFSEISFDILAEINSSGDKPVIILNDVINIYLGSKPVVAVYANSQKVW